MARSSKSKTQSRSQPESRPRRPIGHERRPTGNGNFHLEFKNDAQGLAWAAFKQHDVLFLTGPAGTGKAQPLDAIVYTPSGEKTMEEISVGDQVLTPNGTSNVIAEHPQGKIKIYKINFVDGDSVECCENHLWKVSNPNNQWKESKLVSTKWIIDNCNNQNRRNIEIETPEFCNFEEREVSIDPYLLGFMLGDGSFRGSVPVITTADVELIEHLKQTLEEGYLIKKLKTKYGYSISKGRTGGKTNLYTELIKSYDLWGLKSEHKFIPNDYLFNTKEIRMAILQGLMDTDGSVDQKGGVEYSSSSMQLAENIKFLVQSLGGLCKIVKKETSCLPSYRCYIKFKDPSNLFKLSRKQHRCKVRNKLVRRIKNVEFSGFKTAKCITLSDENGLYITNNFIVTHNSFLACAFAIEQILNKEKSKIVLTRPIVESGESLGFLPGDFEEKVNPYMMPMYDCIEKLVGKDNPWRDRIDSCLEVAPLAYMRGRSLKNTELLPTPTGMKPIGEMQVGDYVIGSNGLPTKVIGVYPQGDLPIYEVRFSDKTTSICSGDHLWNTMTLNEKRHNKGYTTKNTLEIKENLKNKHNQKIHRIPMVSGPVQFESCEIQVDPYLLGVLLGDGHIRKGAVRISSVDEEILTECEQRIPNGLSLKKRNGCDYAIVSENKDNQLLKHLYDLKLVGSKSNTKFVPDNYKFNSVDVRLSVLQGLLDTDGWICKHRSGNCRIQYCSTSKKLSEDVMFLVRSLGGHALCNRRDFDESDSHLYKNHIIRHANSSYVVDIVMPMNPFKLHRKSKQYVDNRKPTKLICEIESIGNAECTCIQVEAEDHLYLTNDFVVTHNTFDDAICIFDEAQNASMMQLKLFMTRFGENSKLIINGDPTQSDLAGDVALVNVMHRLHSVDGIGMVQFKPQQIVRHPLIGKIIEKLEG